MARCTLIFALIALAATLTTAQMDFISLIVEYNIGNSIRNATTSAPEKPTFQPQAFTTPSPRRLPHRLVSGQPALNLSSEATTRFPFVSNATDRVHVNASRHHRHHFHDNNVDMNVVIQPQYVSAKSDEASTIICKVHLKKKHFTRVTYDLRMEFIFPGNYSFVKNVTCHRFGTCGLELTINPNYFPESMWYNDNSIPFICAAKMYLPEGQETQLHFDTATFRRLDGQRIYESCDWSTRTCATGRNMYCSFYDSTCTCNSGYVPLMDDYREYKCVKKVDHSEFCTDDIQCSAKDLHSQCRFNLCQCNTNYKYNGVRCHRDTGVTDSFSDIDWNNYNNDDDDYIDYGYSSFQISTVSLAGLAILFILILGTYGIVRSRRNARQRITSQRSLVRPALTKHVPKELSPALLFVKSEKETTKDNKTLIEEAK